MCNLPSLPSPLLPASAPCGFHSARTAARKDGPADSAEVPHENAEDEWRDEPADGAGGETIKSDGGCGASVIDMDDL